MYRVTPRANEDLKNIARYTKLRWGIKQRDRYLQDIVDLFQQLGQQPQLGRHRADIAEGYYCLPIHSHLVFYLIGDDGIDVIGVPHKKMDVYNYFGTSDYPVCTREK